MVKRIWIVLFVLLFLNTGVSLGLAQDGKEIFLKSLDPEVDYTAYIKIYIEDKTFATEYTKIDGWEGYKFLINGKEIFIVKKGNKIGRNIDVPKGTFSFMGLNLPKKTELVLKNYKVELKGTEIVSKRTAYHIVLIPIYEGNLREEIWIDKESYIQLKSSIYDWNGKFLKGKEVISLTIYKETPPILKEMKEILSRNAKKLSPWYRSYEEAEKGLKTKLLKPSWLPKGYELVGIHASNRFKDTIHIVYTNGIGYISLYEKKVPIWARREKGPHRGPHPNWEKKGVRLLLIGDVDDDLLYEMAKSIGEREVKGKEKKVKEKTHGKNTENKRKIHKTK